MNHVKKNNCAAFKALLRTKEKLNLLLIDIDNFSNINYSYGVDYGDAVFVKILDILHGFKFTDVEIYKLESDEFAIVKKDNFDLLRSEEEAKLIISYFNESDLELDEDISIRVSLSISIAVGSGLSLINNARLAIKELREHTRGSYIFYDMKSQYARRVQDNVYWVNKIQASVADDKVVAFFQPIVNNKTKKIEKYECLARIEDEGEYISPYHFMDAAKEARVLSFITKVIIKKACKMFSNNDYEFSINITNDDLQLNYLEEYLLRNTKLFNINPNRVVLELLEDIPTLDKKIVLQQLDSLKARGFKLAVDDFGSASSNFSRLLEFDPDYLKIDGAFIKDIIMDNKSQIITQGIVKIAHGMNMKVIAEYIHSQDIQDEVVSLGIDYSQGYLHGAPLQTLYDES